jgi:hypothetical protein
MNIKHRHQITFRMKPGEVRALDRLAKRQEISRAELVRRILLKACPGWKHDSTKR